MQKNRFIGLGVALIIWSSSAFSLFAHGRNALLFNSVGTRVEAAATNSEETYVPVYSSLHTDCAFDPTRTCFRFKLELPAQIQEFQVLTQVLGAVQTWTGALETNLSYEYNGLYSGEGIPFERAPDGEIVKDVFQNEVIAGDFLISLKPPASLIFGPTEVAKNFYYVLPNLATGEGDLKWAGIYINPLFNPLLSCTQNCFVLTGQGNFSLRSIVTYQLGLVLGVAPSPLPSSLMFPVQNSSLLKNFSSLHSNEKNWLRSIYPLASEVGSIEGRVLIGADGQGWLGAHLLLLPANQVETVATTNSSEPFIQSAASREDGKFRFEGVPPGDYIILAAAAVSFGLRQTKFDDWFSVRARGEFFPGDFYDGKDRESNKELGAYSPSFVRIAATVKVVANEPTTGVTVVTQDERSSIREIKAEGSSNESPSSLSFEDLSDLLKTQLDQGIANQTEKPKGGGGCLLSDREVSGSNFYMILFFLGLCFWFRIRAKKIRLIETFSAVPFEHP